MTETVQRSTLERDRVLKYVCNGCAALGICIALIASKCVGMSASAMPVVTLATVGLWVVGLVAGYLAFVSSREGPLAAPFWLNLSGFVGAYSSLLLTLMILAGYLFYPTIEKSFVAKWNPYWLMLSLFVMGLAIDFQDWKRIVKSPKVIGIAVLIRWAFMPLAAYVVGYLIFVMLVPGQTGKTLAVGMILLGTAPTGTTSNALTMIARGDLALSVSVTTVNTLLAPFLLPVLMQFLAGSMAAVNTGAMFIDLIRMVILPVASGSILGSIFVKQCTRMRPTFAPLAIIFLGLIMMGSMSKGTNVLLKQLYILLYLVPACVLFAMVGYSIGFYIPGLFGFTRKQRIAACFEVGVANAALTMTLAIKYFGPLAVLVSILYGKIMVIMGSVVIVPLFGDKEGTAGAEELSNSNRKMPL
jgi:BASS family bile acid:Na+ symporter